jgi:hypothetical protein
MSKVFSKGQIERRNAPKTRKRRFFVSRDECFLLRARGFYWGLEFFIEVLSGKNNILS